MDLDNFTVHEIKHDLLQMINASIGAGDSAYLWSLWLRSMTCSILLNNSLGAGHQTCLCSKWAQNFQIMFFMLEWSIYRQLMLNKGWKIDSIHIHNIGT
jgi:hypothetical protein